MNQAQVRLWSVAALGLVLGLAFGRTTSAQGQGTAPTVRVEHKGRLLVLNYRSPGAGGPQASAGTPDAPPRFVLYQGRRQIAAGQFEYG